MSERTIRIDGSGFLCSAVFIVFLVLKLCGVINWSWWWVTAPLWGSVVLAVGLIAVGLLIWLACMGVAWLWLKWRG